MDTLSLAIAIWKPAAKMVTDNTFVLLLYSSEHGLYLRIHEPGFAAQDPAQVAGGMFDMDDVPAIVVNQPRTFTYWALELVKQLNPFRLFNPRYIPPNVVKPQNDASIALLVQDEAGVTAFGILADDERPGRVKIQGRDQLTATTKRFYTNICEKFILGKRYSRDDKQTLDTLVDYFKSQ